MSIKSGLLVQVHKQGKIPSSVLEKLK